MNPKISVVVPVYNVERYLEYALNSLVQQTFIDDIEVLMIDDGSTDNSRYIMEKYALDYENFHAYHKENEGLSITRNYGLKLAKGEYVHFMDSDDLMITDAYEKLYNLASKNDSEVVTADFLRFNENNAWIQPISDYIFSELESNIDETNAYKYHKLLWDTPAWNKIFKREFVLKEKLEFLVGVPAEDLVFVSEALLKANGIKFINKPVVEYMPQATSVTSTRNKEVLLKFIESYTKLFNMANSFNRDYAWISYRNLFFWMKQFCSGDPSDENFRRRIIDVFINSIYLYDNRVVIFYNIRGGKQVSYIDLINSSDLPADGECSDLVRYAPSYGSSISASGISAIAVFVSFTRKRSS